MAPVEVPVKWGGKEFTVACEEDETVSTLKHKLEQETKVLSKRQKVRRVLPGIDDRGVGCSSARGLPRLCCCKPRTAATQPAAVRQQSK